MKIRNGFVSNSSSSSFVIKKDNLTKFQLHLITNHKVYSNSFNEQINNLAFDSCGDSEEWNISETDEAIEGYTCMDNFNMDEYLRWIGVNPTNIEWRE